MRQDILAVIVVALLVTALVAASLGASYFTGGSRVGVPSVVTVTGYAMAMGTNSTSEPIVYHTGAPSWVAFSFLSCDDFLNVSCYHTFNSSVNIMGVYSVSVPNNHPFYIDVGGSGNNPAHGCHPVLLEIPIYSYLPTINYNVTAFCLPLSTP